MMKTFIKSIIFSRQSEFTCDNGQCISKFSVCDGSAECSDQSDETYKGCSTNQCPEYAFQCRYGACIDGDAVCNGIIDCIDGSDEIEQYCKWNKRQEEWDFFSGIYFGKKYRIFKIYN